MTKEIKKLRKLAMSMRLPYRDKPIHVSHVLPRAYCVAKPGLHNAVFAVPAKDREPQVRDDQWATVCNETANNVHLGEWASIAYICDSSGCGGMYVLPTE